MATKKRPNAFSTRRELASLQEIPNIGPSLAESLERAGIKRPGQLKGKDPYVLYATLCKRTGVRHDPCVLDTFISAVRYMEGGPVQPWWHFTRERRENQARYDALMSAGSVRKRVAAVRASRVRPHKPKS
ncbi:MAG: helix-hairpin-helix domain-containing protein [Gemmatimonadaceae bacterium]